MSQVEEEYELLKDDTGKTMKVVSFKIENDLLAKLDLYAVNKRVTRSEVIREAIAEFLNKKR